jgi:hypothetical protein
MADVDSSRVHDHRREASRFFLAMVAVCLLAGIYFLTEANDRAGFTLIFAGCPLFLVSGGYVRKDELPQIPAFLKRNPAGGT